MGKRRKHKKTSYIRETKGQPFPGDHKAARSRQDRMTRNTYIKKDPQKNHRLGTVSKKITGGLKHFDSTNLILISDEYSDIYGCLVCSKDP